MDLFEKLDSALKNLYSIFKKESVKVNKISKKRCGAPEGPPPYSWEKIIKISEYKYFFSIDTGSRLISPNIKLSISYPDIKKTLFAIVNSDDDFAYYITIQGPHEDSIAIVTNLSELKNIFGFTDEELEELISKINLLAIERM